MTNIFITGAKSFVGKRLIKKLKILNINVTAIDILSNDNNEDHIQADICDSNIVDIIPENSSIIHLAAISKPSICQDNPKLAFDVNVNGTINLFEAAIKKNAKNFIFASSEWVYDRKTNDKKLFDENSLINIFNIESILPFTKLISENYLNINKLRIPVNILRFGIIYGPREEELIHWSAVDYIFHQIKYYNEVSVGSLNTSRCFIHINDIINAVISVINRTNSDTFNISGNKLISLADIISASSSILNKNPNIIEKNASNSSIRGASNLYALKNLNWTPEIDLKKGLNSLNDYLDSNFANNE